MVTLLWAMLVMGVTCFWLQVQQLTTSTNITFLYISNHCGISHGLMVKREKIQYEINS